MRAKEFLRESDQIVDANFIQNLVKGIHRRLHDFEEGDLVDRIYWFSQYKLVELPISNIDLDEWDLDDDLVTDHVAEIMRSKHTMPPIVFDPISKSIIDGTHRANAYHKLGMKTIPAYVGTVRSSEYGQTSDYENESISESSGETISLEQLYQGDYPDRDEEFWDHVRPSDFRTQLPIQTMQRHIVMITMLGMYQAEHIDEVVDMLEPEQLEVVQRYENDPDLSNKIVLVSDHRIIDGNHRALAAALKGVPIKYVELTEDLDEAELDPTGWGNTPKVLM